MEDSFRFLKINPRETLLQADGGCSFFGVFKVQLLLGTSRENH